MYNHLAGIWGCLRCARTKGVGGNAIYAKNPLLAWVWGTTLRLAGEVLPI